MVKKTLGIIIIFIISFFSFHYTVHFMNVDNKPLFGQAIAVYDNGLKLAGIDYNESLSHINNPERGFYRTGIAWLTSSGADHTGYASGPLVHLRVSLAAFNNTNGDIDIPEIAVEQFKVILEGYRSRNTNIIIRFNYDGGAGTPNLEPSMEQIEKHIEQLSTLFYEYDDVIISIDTGLFGPWGEQHSSSIITSDNIKRLVQAFLDNTPDGMQVSVRRPSYFAMWAGINNNDLHLYKAVVGSDAYRVGVYNDGYLGSNSDLGTFPPHPDFGYRENENRWFVNHNTHTLYGGEVVANAWPDAFAYNSGEYMSYEMFITHTAYLNSEWNQSVINAWKAETYIGSDPLYQGQSFYTYISNHMGYRYVLKSSFLNEVVYTNDGNTLSLKGNIENVGAGNLVNSKKVEIIITDGSYSYKQEVDYDFTKLLSKTVNPYHFNISLPNDIPKDPYDVYLKLSSDDVNSLDKYYVQFANNDIWNDTINANYLGTVTVDEKEVYTVSSTNPEIILSKSNFFIGEIVSFQITTPIGYRVKENSLKILNGSTLVNYSTDMNTYQFEMIDNDVVISVLFEEIPKNDTVVDNADNNNENNNEESDDSSDEVITDSSGDDSSDDIIDSSGDDSSDDIIGSSDTDINEKSDSDEDISINLVPIITIIVLVTLSFILGYLVIKKTSNR